MTPQAKRVLGFLGRYKTITALTALEALGVMSLSSRICELKREGFKIEGKKIAVHNRYGETVHVNKYTLKAK